MDTEDRSQRIAAALERQLISCDAALATCLEGRSPQELLSEWPLRRMLSLMKTSAQLASTIGRLEARTAAKKNREK
ncbi:MAG TPA: hypothetical protein VHW69_09800 [Rhizomicrobium sp.]|jgi:hypothetical protein|nr:hypothetical protein [Rhizomicrobium sp.]